MGMGSMKIERNICRKERSRRVVDANLLHPDEAKSKGAGVGEVRWGEIRSGDGREDGGRPLWVGRGSASLIILSYYLSFFINIDLAPGDDAHPKNGQAD